MKLVTVLAWFYSTWNEVFYDVTKGMQEWCKWTIGILLTVIIFISGFLILLCMIPMRGIYWVFDFIKDSKIWKMTTSKIKKVVFK